MSININDIETYISKFDSSNSRFYAFKEEIIDILTKNIKKQQVKYFTKWKKKKMK